MCGWGGVGKVGVPVYVCGGERRRGVCVGGVGGVVGGTSIRVWRRTEEEEEGCVCVTSMLVCLVVCSCVCVCVCVCVWYMCVGGACVYVCVRACARMCVRACVYVCACVHAYVCVCARVVCATVRSCV